MTHFTAIPLIDIKNFLVVNNIKESKNPHQDAWQLINKNKQILVPESIADFFLAHNLVRDNLPVYKLSKVLSHNFDKNLPITLQNLTKKRVIRILKYLGKLDNDLNIFDILPQDISHIIVNKLDIYSIRLICEISQRFVQFCRTHLQPLLKQNLQCSTPSNIANFGMQQLINLSKSQGEATIKHYRSLILKDGMIYKDEERIFEIDNIIELAVSDYHGFLLDSAGAIYSFGKNNYGQLGLHHYYDCEVPQLVPDIFDVISISVSNTHTMLLTADAKVYVNQNAEFVLLDTINNIIQISAGNEHSLLLSSDNIVYSYQNDKVTELIKGMNIEMVSSSNNHSLLLDKNGNVYSYGNNKYGQLGLGNQDEINEVLPIPDITNIVYVIAGKDYSLLLNKEGQAYQFGLIDQEVILTPMPVDIPDIIK